MLLFNRVFYFLFIFFFYFLLLLNSFQASSQVSSQTPSLPRVSPNASQSSPVPNKEFPKPQASPKPQALPKPQA